MQFPVHENKSKIILLLQILQSVWNLASCFEFDQNYFGVTFQPYVKQAENRRETPKLSSYTRKNVDTMISVVSRKFSQISVSSTFSMGESYIQNYTYHKKSYVSIFSGEIAAEINKRDGKRTVKLFLQLAPSSSYKRRNAGLLLAFEASEKSNKIFPGTVEGVAIGQPQNPLQIEEMLRLLQLHRQNASKHGVKIGVGVDCHKFNKAVNITVIEVYRQIINASDFIFCGSASTNPTIRPAVAFEKSSKSFLSFKNHIKAVNANVEVIAITEWSSYGLQDGNAIENLKVYWETANDWAVRNKFRIFLNEAFDNPWDNKAANAHFGWWKLKSNSKIDSVDGYEEKVSGDENAKGPNAGLSVLNVVIISFTITLTLIGMFAFAFFLYFKRHQNKLSILSSSEIKDFIDGNSIPNGNDSESGINTATSAPYDASLEIPKGCLNIDKTKILGSGEFGIVFKAQIEWESGCTDQVALKVTKDNCRSSTLKGFLSEIKIMSYLGQHHNIVALKGAYTAELSQGIVYVATELCALGSLVQFLRKKRIISTRKSSGEDDDVVPGMNAKPEQEAEMTTTAPGISMLDMVRWSYEIACGMKYLEGKHVVHADLAARNVLLTSEKVAKVSDFGLSRRMYNYANYVKTQQEPLPWRWMAIEVLNQLDFSSKSDAWSYGITLWEIFSQGNIPFPGISWTQSFVKELENGLRPDCPEYATPEIYKMMRDCWNFEVNKRPGFSVLVDVTRNALEKFISAAGSSTLYTPMISENEP